MHWCVLNWIAYYYFVYIFAIIIDLWFIVSHWDVVTIVMNSFIVMDILFSSSMFPKSLTPIFSKSIIMHWHILNWIQLNCILYFVCYYHRITIIAYTLRCCDDRIALNIFNCHWHLFFFRVSVYLNPPPPTSFKSMIDTFWIAYYVVIYSPVCFPLP